MNKAYFEVLPENKFVCGMLREHISGNNKFPAEVMPLVKEIRKIIKAIADNTRFTDMAFKLSGKEFTKSLMLYLETF